MRIINGLGDDQDTDLTDEYRVDSPPYNRSTDSTGVDEVPVIEEKPGFKLTLPAEVQDFHINKENLDSLGIKGTALTAEPFPTSEEPSTGLGNDFILRDIANGMFGSGYTKVDMVSLEFATMEERIKLSEPEVPIGEQIIDMGMKVEQMIYNTLGKILPKPDDSDGFDNYNP